MFCKLEPQYASAAAFSSQGGIELLKKISVPRAAIAAFNRWRLSCLGRYTWPTHVVAPKNEIVELVFGLAGPVGTNFNKVTAALSDAPSKVQYSVVPLRLSTF